MLDKFYPIVPDISWIKRLVPLGVKLIQLRCKNLSQEELFVQICEALTITQTYGCQLIVNDYWELALDAKASYVHLGQEDLDQADTKALAKAGIKLGISTHNVQELERALAYTPDYIALGPIYFTKLKAMRFDPQGVEKLRDWKMRIGALPLVAIGGFTPQRVQGAFDHGADSVAVVTDIITHPNPEEQTKLWISLTR